jgi:tRNA nucleotidyltransferase/poly(A) polymerase
MKKRRLMLMAGILNEQVEVQFNIDLPKEIKILKEAFSKEGFKIYLVGGCIRDVFLGKTPKDYDLTTAAKPNEVVDILNKYNIKNFPKGEQFGVVSAVIDGEEFEIATFRSEEYDGSGRRPNEVKYSTIEKDSDRRDLTINALYYDIEDKKIIDFHGGLEDLKNGKIKTVGTPENRFYEDRLRVMRAIRFKNITGGSLDDETKKAILKYSDMPGVSNERIREEFYSGIKKSKDTKAFLKDLFDFKIMDRMFPKMNINTNFINSKNPFIIIGNILINNDSSKVYEMLTEMKFKNDEKKVITFLVNFFNYFKDFNKIDNQSQEDADYFSKLLSMQSLLKKMVKKEDFISFCNINGIDKKIGDKFYDFIKLAKSDIKDLENKISTGELPKQGIELGNYIKNSNFEFFKSLI